MPYYLLSVADVAAKLTTSPAGLDAATAGQRLAKHGPNQLTNTQQKTVWQLLLHQLANVMILVLLAAAGVSVLIGEAKSAYIILAIVLLNGVIGFVQEYRADKAMEALQQMAASHAQVLRDGQPTQVPAAELVPGDVVLLEAGNMIPADVRFLEAHALKVDESSLTGESSNVEKTVEALPPGDYPLGDRRNLGYKGTSVTNGRATAYVVATGMHTELGKIATSIQTAEVVTPLQKRLGTLGKRLSGAVLVMAALFFGVGWLRGEPWENLLLVSISLAIAALPEALPALVTVSLALGAGRLMKSHALIRKLPAVETLGSVTYICTDKTGTLTLNQMTVQDVYELPALTLAGLADHNALLTAMALNTDATCDDENQWLGDSTEVALARYAAEQDYARSGAGNPVSAPGRAALRLGAPVHDHAAPNPAGRAGASPKGPWGRCSSSWRPASRPPLPTCTSAWTPWPRRATGCWATPARLLPELPADLTPATIETGLTFLGFASLMDPPREEARQAVAECKTAGIIPVMITGDHKLTAKAIAEQLGIISSEEELVLTGPELTALDEPAFAAVVENVRVYARVDPAQKLRIISALQARHQFVAMTGDGVNDAPALKNADIGIAMGINGTEVAKEAAALILLDDDFATIVEAVQARAPHLRQHHQVHSLPAGRQRGRDNVPVLRPVFWAAHSAAGHSYSVD